MGRADFFVWSNPPLERFWLRGRKELANRVVSQFGLRVWATFATLHETTFPGVR